MERYNYNSLQLREIFHVEFLRWLNNEIKIENYILKGGSNLRFFFSSIRYSEDMDIDISNTEVGLLKDSVMKILNSTSFKNNLNIFGIDNIIVPDMTKAKQTKTTQRFKVQLLASSGEDLFTKIEFSRRGFKGNNVISTIDKAILRDYKCSPVLVSHYDGCSALIQKIEALAARSMVQARDIFDIYNLSSQLNPSKIDNKILGKIDIDKAHQRIFEIDFNQFYDTVISYLSFDNQVLYGNKTLWDEIKLETAEFLEELKEV